MEYYHSSCAPFWDQPLELYVRDTNFFHFNWHTGFELTVLLKGRLNFYINGSRYTMNEDDVFLINPNCGHAIVSEEKCSAALSLHFPPEYISIPAPRLKNITIDCASTADTRSQPRFARLRHCVAQMMLAAMEDKPWSPFLLHGAFIMLLGILLSDFCVMPACEDKSPRDRRTLKTIKAVIAWIEKNYGKRVSLEDAAKVARYSRTYFSTFFTRNVGITFYDYLMRVRFRHALYLLNNTDMSLTDIADDCGFADLKTFSAYYKKTLHEPPSARRGKDGANAFIPVRENERVYLDTSVPFIGEKLRAYTRLELPEPSSAVSTLPVGPEDIDRIAALCGQILELTGQKRPLQEE